MVELHWECKYSGFMVGHLSKELLHIVGHLSNFSGFGLGMKIYGTALPMKSTGQNSGLYTRRLKI